VNDASPPFGRTRPVARTTTNSSLKLAPSGCRSTRKRDVQLEFPPKCTPNFPTINYYE
jgi:hypothetical protein